MIGRSRSGERSMWSAVLLTVLSDYNRDYWRAIKNGGAVEHVLADVRRYFASRDGRIVASCAGVEINLPNIIATISLPRDQFKARMTILPEQEAQP